MPILNYTTTVPVVRTIADIQKLLMRAKAKQIMTEYDDDGNATGMSFFVTVNDKPLIFKMPVDVTGVRQAMKNDPDCKNSYCRNEQYPRVAWRILKYWIEAQLAMVEANQATVPQVFLPYAVTNNSQTVYERLSGDGFKLLGCDK